MLLWAKPTRPPSLTASSSLTAVRSSSGKSRSTTAWRYGVEAAYCSCSSATVEGSNKVGTKAEEPEDSLSSLAFLLLPALLSGEGDRFAVDMALLGSEVGGIGEEAVDSRPSTSEAASFEFPRTGPPTSRTGPPGPLVTLPLDDHSPFAPQQDASALARLRCL